MTIPPETAPAPELIAEALESKLWRDGIPDSLAQLSPLTEVDGVDVFAETIDWDGNSFAADCVVYVGLTYGEEDDDDGVSTSDNFPGRVRGHRSEGDAIVIDEISFDTSSFYE